MKGSKGFIFMVLLAIFLLMAAGPVRAGSLHLYYSTFLGGGDNDYGYEIAVDNLGNAYVTGKTESTDFPTGHAFQGTYAGGWDAFVFKIGMPSVGDELAVDFGGTQIRQ